MAREREPSVEIVAFQIGVDGAIQTFRSVDEAASYFKVHRDTILRRIITGQKVGREYFVDWAWNADPDVTAQLEDNYLKRLSSNKKYSKKWRDSHASS